MKNPSKFHVFAALTCVYAAFLFFLSSLSAPPGPPAIGFLYDLVHLLEDLGLKFIVYPFYFAYRYPDKFAHMILYMGLGLLLNRTLSSSKNEILSKYAVPFALLIGMLYGVTDEFHQVFVPYRSASAMDLFADFMGLLFAQLLIFVYVGIKKLSKSEDKFATSFDLGLVLLFTFLAYLFVLVPPFNQTPLRIIFALPIILFLPGYVLIAALFPKKEELSGIERFTLSIGLSIAIFVFDGFAISVTAWRFRPEPIILSLALIILILTLITFLVRSRIAKEERFYFDFAFFSKFVAVMRTDEKPSEPSDIEKALVIALVGSIIIASGMLIYAKVTFEEERFTAFYILGEGGKAENYPKEVYLLEPSSLIVGIDNYEHGPANYTIQAKLGGYPLQEQQIMLAHGEKWEEVVFFTPRHVGKHLKLEFLLYKDGSTNPYRSTHLWVDSLIDYDNLAAIMKYALTDLPIIKNPDMELESDWTFTQNTRYFRGHFTKFYRLVENATVCGYVTDNVTGEEIANARVSVNNHYGYEKSNTTNESGYYELRIIADHFWMHTTVRGYKLNETEFDIAGGQILVVNMTNDPIMAFNITLEELSIINETIATLPAEELPKEVSTVKGYVIDNVTGIPIANASVKVRNEYGFERHTTTNEYGYYEVSTISGRSTIEVRAGGYASNTTTVVIASVHTVNPKLSPENAIIYGYITDSTTGAAVSNAYVRASGTGYSNYTRTNESGYYTVKTIAGHILLDVSKDGYFSSGTEFNITYGEIRTIDMVVEPVPPELPLATISGYVSCNNTRLPWVKVVISDGDKYEKSTLTDGSGYFELKTVPGHLWLDVLPGVYMDTSVEFNIKSGQTATLDIKLDAFPESTYQIDYPSETPVEKGYYGGIYQDIVSEEGVATLSVKVSDSHRTNSSSGNWFKQVLLNERVVWEDDVAGSEGWQEVEFPITLDNGTNRLMLRVYAKQDSNGFPVTVWWDDVRIERFEEITKEIATSFYILDANGTDENYPTELYLGEPAWVIAEIENQEQEPVNYTLQVKLAGELLRSEKIQLEDGSKWEQKISFIPNQIGSLLKLEFLLFKEFVSEAPYKSFHLWVSADIDHDNLEVLKDYVVSPLPALINGDMESETLEAWKMENTTNFTVKITDSASVSPMHSYELSYPAETAFDTGCYAGIYQNFTAETVPATIVIAFNVRDTYSGEEEGNFKKQVLLNEEVIWEDDVAGDERWQNVKIPVTLRSAKNKLMLRVYGAREGTNFPVTVWWDDVKIEPITEIAEKIAPSFYVLDTEGTEENYPEKLYLGEPTELLVGIVNNEHKQVNYIVQIKLDGRVLKSESKWLEPGSGWEKKMSFKPDRIGENQKLEFLLFKDYVKVNPDRYFHLRVSTGINYDNLESLLGYGIEHLPKLEDGDMGQTTAWTVDYNGSFRGSRSTENASTPYSYCIAQYRDSDAGDCGVLTQDIYASTRGVVVISFNVKDTYTTATKDVENITKRVELNEEVIWSDDVSGTDGGYVGWVEEDYNWLEEEWVKIVPGVKSGWMHIDVPVYLWEGNNKLRLGVYAEEGTDKLPVDVYWDDVEILSIDEFVKVGEGVRMKRYGW